MGALAVGVGGFFLGRGTESHPGASPTSVSPSITIPASASGDWFACIADRESLVSAQKRIRSALAAVGQSFRRTTSNSEKANVLRQGASALTVIASDLKALVVSAQLSTVKSRLEQATQKEITSLEDLAISWDNNDHALGSEGVTLGTEGNALLSAAAADLNGADCL